MTLRIRKGIISRWVIMNNFWKTKGYGLHLKSMQRRKLKQREELLSYSRTLYFSSIAGSSRK
jgi:hypothetical protein